MESYRELAALPDRKSQLTQLMKIADEQLISPLTVYKQVNACAELRGEPPLALEPAIYRWMTRFNQRYPNLSETIFDGELPPEPARYVEVVSELFDTPFYEVLGRFLNQSGKGPGYVQTVLDVPLLDARGLHDALT